MDEYDDYDDYDYDDRSGSGAGSGSGTGAGFDEDALDDDEYELLHDMLPVLRQRADAERFTAVPTDLLKEYLWEAHWDMDEALTIVKECHKRTYHKTKPMALSWPY